MKKSAHVSVMVKKCHSIALINQIFALTEGSVSKYNNAQPHRCPFLKIFRKIR